jgi:hypothetical protein
MKVYRPGEIGRKSVFIAPGVEFPTSEFVEDGKPKQFDIKFVNGVADVSEEIGRYMVDKELAKTSPIILVN